MRIIAGEAKGRRLCTPKGFGVRPTTDRVKEAIFSMISPYIQESIILDLFSGTGSLGLEALSRGAKKGYFVDKSRKSIKLTQENIQHMGFQSQSEIRLSDAVRAIEDFVSLGIMFDIVFMDPPYGKGLVLPCMKAINKGKILNRDAIIVIEHDETEKIEIIDHYRILKEKKYGNTFISVYIMKEE